MRPTLMRRRPRSLEDLADELRRLDAALAVGPDRRWQPQVWPRARRRLNRRYDARLLQAADMLGVAVPPPADWASPGFRGGLFDNRTGAVIEGALRSVGFDPWAIAGAEDA